ncbi:MAG: hypothetical protein ACM3SU_00660 [Acidobacteriota bacterium]
MNAVACLLALLAAGFSLRVALKRPSSNFAVLSGACLALAAWCQPAALVLSPLLSVPLLDRRYPLRARVHLTASALLGVVLVLLPRALSRV